MKIHALCSSAHNRIAVIAICLVFSQLAAQSAARSAADNPARCVPPPSGLVSWWPGDRNADDIVGPNSGQLFGGATFSSGYVGSAFSFNGTTAYFQSTSLDLPVGSADRTLEMWEKLDAVVPGGTAGITYFESFFAGYGNFGTNDEAFWLTGKYQPPYGESLMFTQWGDSLSGPLLFPLYKRPRPEWHHVAVTSEGSYVYLFLDGVPVATQVPTFSIYTPAETPFLMGMIPGPLGDIRRMRGELDEVSVYNRALQPHEIWSIFKAGRAGKCKP